MDYLFVAEKVMAEIEAKIVAQGDKIRELKAAKAAKDVIQPEVNSCHKNLHHCYVHCPMSIVHAGGNFACSKSRIQGSYRRRLETYRSSFKGCSGEGSQSS